ncbi:cadherin-like domain-containing protein, partial [Asticcacaulis sp. AC402]|uniref:cadherin-like domain-containing protein n=1 Tax=Asticcacaulis sp. AC402 TaxID=1282361 RepID=UPI0005904FA0
VTSVNDLPTGAPIGNVADGTEDTAQTILASTLLEGFSDVEGALTISAISVTNGTLTAVAGGWTYTPTANYHGPVTVTYTVSDSDGASITGQTRSFSLTSVNDLPAGSPTGTVANGTEDITQTILASTLLQGFSDVDGDTLTVTDISVTHGTLTSTDGGWIFTPEDDYNG